MKYPIGERIFAAVGWIMILPSLLFELFVRGLKWLKRKMFLMIILATCAGCYSPDTVYVREYYQPRPFGTSLYIHHDHHYDHHNDHYRHSNRRSSSPTRKVVTPTRTPPPSRPISKGVPEPPSNPRDRR